MKDVIMGLVGSSVFEAWLMQATKSPCKSHNFMVQNSTLDDEICSLKLYSYHSDGIQRTGNKPSHRHLTVSWRPLYHFKHMPAKSADNTYGHAICAARGLLSQLTCLPWMLWLFNPILLIGFWPRKIKSKPAFQQGFQMSDKAFKGNSGL